MDFGDAIRALKDGKRVARAGWNGKGMWLGLVPEWTFTNGQWDNVVCAPFIGMKTAVPSANGVPVFIPWLASQTDVLAEDWELV